MEMQASSSWVRWKDIVDIQHSHFKPPRLLADTRPIDDAGGPPKGSEWSVVESFPDGCDHFQIKMMDEISSFSVCDHQLQFDLQTIHQNPLHF